VVTKGFSQISDFNLGAALCGHSTVAVLFKWIVVQRSGGNNIADRRAYNKMASFAGRN
jgi:hypothetical protein